MQSETQHRSCWWVFGCEFSFITWSTQRTLEIPGQVFQLQKPSKALSLDGHPVPFCFASTVLRLREGGCDASYKSFIYSVQSLWAGSWALQNQGAEEITSLKTGAAEGARRSSLCLSSFPSLKHRGLSWGCFGCLTRPGIGEDCAAGASRQAQPAAAFCLWWFCWLMHWLTTSLFLRGKCEAVVNLVSDQRHCSHVM